jgi:hypothetical protein
MQREDATSKAIYQSLYREGLFYITLHAKQVFFFLLLLSLCNTRSTMNNVPLDILPNIFSFIDSTSQLANCRLVCRVWDTFAEEAMLGRNIDIGQIETAWAFYDHIVQAPSKDRFVKHLDIGKLDLSTCELNKRLLRLIFTPNLQVLRGQNCQSDFYDEMVKIAKESPVKCRKLKVIPHPLSFTKSYSDAAMLLKDTLGDVLVNDLDMLQAGEHDLEYLKQFKHLTSFAFYFSSIVLLGDIDVLLGALPQVKEIKLYVTAEADSWTMDYDTEDLKRIPTNNALKVLKVTTASAAILCVFMSKFVALESLELDLEVEYEELEVPYAVMLVAKPVSSLDYTFMALKCKFMGKERIENLFGKVASITCVSRLQTGLFFGGRVEHDNSVYIVKVKS